MEITICDLRLRSQGSSSQTNAFSEHGVLMLSSVLKSNRAIEMNIKIMRIFIKMRKMLSMQHEVLAKIEKIEEKLEGHDQEITTLFQYLKRLMQDNSEKEIQKKTRKKIGFQMK